MADTASIGLKVRDKVIVITGGARGIGLATATALHNLGAKVAMPRSVSMCTASSM
jgi:NAD(P)-dependent dehydrogenase (short-subunit alcohol dehydrogenase family)